MTNSFQCPTEGFYRRDGLPHQIPQPQSTNSHIKETRRIGTGLTAERLSGCPSTALASIPNTGKLKKKIAATYLVKKPHSLAPLREEGYCHKEQKGRVRGRSLDPFAEVLRTNVPGSPWCQVGKDTSGSSAAAWPQGLLEAEATAASSRRDLQRSQDSSTHVRA